MVADAFGIPTITVDLTGTFEALITALPPTHVALAAANLKPRLRMVTLYYLAAAHGYLVVGSGNRAEIAVGYFTKYGDGGADILPLAGLLKGQVRTLAAELGVPQIVIDRPPTAGLWPGQTDEGEMGITYRELDHALASIEAGRPEDVDPSVLIKVQTMRAKSAHKRMMPPAFPAAMLE
jgi:NAD+ synthase